MGKWTANYYDEVLGTKIKTLVMGAIERSRLEKSDLTISYETFVESLEMGDSFAASVIDIVVKELAERHTRPLGTDRYLISERTSKSLRLLANPARIYREPAGPRGLSARRVANLSEFLSAPPDVMDLEEDDDEFESMVQSATISPFEGARIDSELYDAYGAHPQSYFQSLARRVQPTNSAAPSSASESNLVDPIIPPLHSPPAPTRRGPWSLSPYTASAGLSRPTLRRPVRSRASDFNEFTTRRRIAVRQNAAQDASSSRSDAEEPLRFGLLPTPAHSPMPEEPLTSNAAQSARRFFPFSRTRHHEVMGSAPWNEHSDERDSESSTTPSSETSTSQPWFLMPGSALPSSHGNNAEENAPTPRLRRGGIRAPESILPRQVSPSVGVTVFGATSLRPLEHPLRHDDSVSENEGTAVVEHQPLTPRSENLNEENIRNVIS